MAIRFTIVDSVCRGEPGFYTDLFSFFTTGYYFAAIVIIVIFGLGTSSNMQSQRRRIQPIPTARVGDAQLLLILLVYVICYACLTLPYHISLMIGVVKPTLLTNTTFRFIQFMAIITLNLSQSVSQFSFLLNSRHYFL
jgi:hypothetical protein